MNDWPLVALEEVCDSVQYGVTASASDDGAGPKLLRITDIVPPLIRWDDVPHCALAEDVVAKFELQRGDIVVARTGATVGYAKLIRNPPADAVFASYLVRFQLGEKADPAFVGQIVQSTAYKEFVAAHAGGAAQPNANARVLGSYRFQLPDLPTQRRIASVLGAFDQLIEINERRIELLESLTQAFFRHWLETTPDSEETTASEVLEVNPKVPKGEGPFPRVTMGDVDTAFSHVLPSATVTRATGTRFQRGDVLMARITPSIENGKTALVLFLDPDQVGVGSTEFIVLRGRKVGPAFVYCSARDPAFRDHAIRSMSGASGRQRVANDCFETLPLKKPSAAAAAKFEETAMPMLELVFELRRTSERFAATRDLLLPRLVSGQLDISDVDLGVLAPPESE
jgi:type I restriction enzyme S subunit